MIIKERILLIDLPTFPKGVVSLSLPAVASALQDMFYVEIIDLNLTGLIHDLPKGFDVYGLKVSSQNFQIAISVSARIRSIHPEVHLLWGGELATLLPEESLKYADTVVCGPFEGIASEFIKDLKKKSLKRKYFNQRGIQAKEILVPKLNLLKLNDYYSFIGLPMETSRGCTQKCTFCMVHTMQIKQLFKSEEQLTTEINYYNGRFINVIDYNLGMNKEHVLMVARVIGNSTALGWMGEMCLESLDDAELLEALKESRCRMIYCGIESIEQSPLVSINKAKTNQIGNYERIIRKAQSYGIQIAAGIILGLKGSTQQSFESTLDFFTRMGIIYAKLTFLTYNPGTKVKESMNRVGSYLTQQIENFDGNHLSYLPDGVNPKTVYAEVIDFISKFYSFEGILARSKNVELDSSTRWEFILFNLCYREVYFSWVENDIFNNADKFDNLLLDPFKKKQPILLVEEYLQKLRLAKMPVRG